MAYILADLSPVNLNAARLSFPILNKAGEEVPGKLSAHDLHVPRPKQLGELWNNLSDLPPSAIYEIREITKALDAAEAYLKRTLEVPDNGKSPLANYYWTVYRAASVLKSIMSDKIKVFCVEDSNRNEILYGDPDDNG